MWAAFRKRFAAKFQAQPEAFASLAYDTMNVLLQAICRAGLNRGRIRDALTGTERYRGVTGEMQFDPNCKNVVPMFLATVRGGRYEFRRYPMQAPYAKVGEAGVEYNGPPAADVPPGPARIGVFGPEAARVAAELQPLLAGYGGRYTLTAVTSEAAWGKATNELVDLIYNGGALALIVTERNAAHLAEQLALKAFLPVVAISDDRALTSANIPWIFRLPGGTAPAEALRTVVEAAEKSGGNRGRLREALGSRFASNGEARRP